MATSEATVSEALKTKTGDKPTFLNFSRATSLNFAKLRHDDTHSDVTLIVGSKSYSSHQIILTTVSSVFRQMFQGNWKENKENSATLEETAECEIVFETFMDFIYGGNNGMISLDVDNVVPLLTLADKYEVLGLKGLCSKFMETAVEGNIERAFLWLSFAEEAQLASVVDRCYNVICLNLKKAATYQVWQALTLNQLLVILKQKNVVVDTEYDVFIAAETWISSKKDESDCPNMVTQLLPFIEFGNMTTAELQKIEKSTIAEMAEKSDDFLVSSNAISDAIGLRALESEFCLAMRTRRRYLSTAGAKEIGFQATSANHLNTALIECSWPPSVDNIEMKCDLNLTYRYADEVIVFKLVVYRNRETRSRRIAGGSKAKTCRVVAVFLLVNKETDIIHHVLNCNAITDDLPTITNGDSIFEFPEIQCLDVGQQFEGHYFRQFEIRYKIIVNSHQTT